MQIDIRAELEEFTFDRPDWSNPSKLICASPFRHDRLPSFYVWLDGDNAGYWGDSGTGEKGGIVRLLALLRDEDESETYAYLADKYAFGGADDAYDESRPLDLSRFQRPGNRQVPLEPSILDALKYRHSYLGQRGISERVQRTYGIGYDRRAGAVTFPWFSPTGSLLALKYRSVSAKTFWYAPGSTPVRALIYGIDAVYRFGWRTVALVESETDVLASVTAGIPAIGVGGSSFNEEKRDIILRSPIEKIVVASDNDAAGVKLSAQVYEYLRGHVELGTIDWGALDSVNDVNDAVMNVGADAYRRAIAECKPMNCLKMSKEK